MQAQYDELKFELEDTAHKISDTVEDINSWEFWLIFLLEDLELMAASLDSEHPRKYKILLENLKEDIETKLEKDIWKSQVK